MFKSSKNIKLISTVLLTVSLLLNIACTRDKPGKKQENPFEYDISKFKKIDPALIKYREIRQIKVNLGKLNSLAVGPENNIYVTGDNTLIIMQGDGQTISRIDPSTLRK